MPYQQMTAFEVIKKKAADIGFGEITLKLIIYDGKVTGFDQLDPALIKFRARNAEKSRTG